MMIDNKEIETVYQRRDTITVKWRMTDWCNYRCSYCIRAQKLQSNLESDSVFITRAKKINSIMESIGKDYELNLIGGEVSYIDLKKVLAEFVSEHFKVLSITTNFSADIDVYKKLIQYCLNRNIDIKITISLHEEYVSVSDLVSKVLLIGKDHLQYIKIEFVLTNENQKSARELKLLCEENGIKRHYDVCRNSDHKTDISKELIKEFNSSLKKTLRFLVFKDGTHGHTAKNNLFLQTENVVGFPSKGLLCWSSTVYIRLTKIRTRTCREYKVIMQNIDDNEEKADFSLLNSFQICPLPYCMLCGNPVITSNKDRINELLKEGKIV